MKFISTVFFAIVALNTLATSYVWNGSVNSSWSVAVNWTPSGVPGPGDNVQIVTATNSCLVDGIYTIDGLSVTSGTIDLSGNLLTVTQNALFSAGTVLNGNLTIAGNTSNSASFNNTSFGPTLNLSVVTGAITLNGGIFGGNVSLEQTGSTNTNGSGGAVFNGTFQFTLSGSGYFRTAGNNTFNQSVTYINNGSNYILPELSGGSIYDGDLTITNNSTSQIRLAYQGNTTFNGNIQFNNSGSGEIRFCEQAAATAALGNGVSLSVGSFTDGQLILRRISQLDATNQSLVLGGSASRVHNIENTWEGNVSFTAPRQLIQDCVFNGDVYLEKTQDQADYSGGNIFNGNTIIVHSGFVNSFRFGRTNPDIFNGNVTLHNLNDGHIRMADNSTGNQINGDLTVFNNSTNSVYFCNESSSDLIINGNIQFNSTGSSNTIIFGSTGNVITLNTGFAVSAGVFDAGEVRFTDFVQLGATTQNLMLTGTGNFTSTNSTWNGDLTVIAPRLNTTNSTYNASVHLEKTGSVDENSGGNLFNGATAFLNSSANAFRFGGTNPDIFNSTLNVQNTGSGRIELARNSAGNEFNGNVTIENTNGEGIWIGENGGTSFLANGFTMLVGGLGFHDGQLRISNFTQVGTTTQTIAEGANSRIRLDNCNFNGTVNYLAERIFLIGNVFNGVTQFTKTGSGDDQSTGGNTFNMEASLINTSPNYLLLANTNPDIFNSDVIITNTGSAIIYMAHNSVGNQFNGDIKVESVGSNGVRFGDGGSGDATLASGNAISLGVSGFDSGDLRFRNFTQLGGTAQNLNLTGSARLMSMESVWNGALVFVAPRIYVRNSTFNGITHWEKTGTIDDTNPGGNIFNSVATIANSGPNIVYMATSNPDIFNGAIRVSSTGSSWIMMGHTATGNQFNGNIEVESTGSSGIRFGQGGGSATLANGHTVTVGVLGFNSGELRFRNFTQVGNTPQSITLTGSGYFLNVTSTWDGNLTVLAPRFYTESTTYNGSVYAEKTGASADNSPGGNVFNGITTISNSGSAQFLFANTNPDIFNGQLTLTNTSSDYIYMSHNSVGNMYNGNIIVESNGSLGIRFGEGGSSTSTLSAGKIIIVGGLGFNSGELRFRNFTQLSATAQNIVLSGTSRLLSMESEWNGSCNFSAPRVYLRNTVHNATAIWSKTGTTDDDSPGGNTFNASSEFHNSGDRRFRMASSTPDVFNGAVLVSNTGLGQIWMADAASGNLFNGNIQVECDNGVGVYFGRGGGTSTLSATHTITLGGLGFTTGELQLRNFTQSGATTQALTLTGTAYLNNYDSDWGGNVTFIAPRHTTRGTIYQGTAYLEKNGAVNDASVGGNTFQQDVELRVSGTGYFMPANTVSNTFQQDVTYVKTSSGLMYPSYNCESFYFGDVNINANAAITFGASTNGKITFSGGASQFIKDVGSGSPMPIFRKLQTSKSGGEVTLNIPIAVSSELELVSGIVFTDLVNLLNMNDNAVVTAVSDLAFVNGPVRKIGNDAFTFPIGKNGTYRPASISGPTNTTHHFTAEYFMVDPVVDGYSDLFYESPIVYISDCEYWIINRTNGASNVAVTLSYKDYGSGGCSGVVDQSFLRVARWDGAMWRDHGNGGTSGTPSNGTVATIAAVTSFSPFTLATTDIINPLPVELVEFQAICTNGMKSVYWKTASELNSDYFVVQGSSDGQSWTDLRKIKAAGNSSHEISYETLIEVDFKYFRLVQVDLDGGTKNTPAIQVTCTSDDVEMVLYPNPTKGQFLIVSEEPVKQVSIMDVSGKLIKTVTSQSLIDLSDLPGGIYLIRVSTEGKSQTLRLILEP